MTRDHFDRVTKAFLAHAGQIQNICDCLLPLERRNRSCGKMKRTNQDVNVKSYDNGSSHPYTSYKRPCVDVKCANIAWWRIVVNRLVKCCNIFWVGFQCCSSWNEGSCRKQRLLYCFLIASLLCYTLQEKRHFDR